MLSPKQREIREREAFILSVARGMLLERGYYGLTMDRIADESDCPKGTMYQRFGCKEDIVMALARQSQEVRLEMMRRATSFEGQTRERAIALGESVALFSRLCPADSRIVHTATGPIREKASPERVEALVEVESQMFTVLLGVLRDAVLKGELVLQGHVSVEEMAFGVWALVDGSFSLIENGVPRAALGLEIPYTSMFLTFNVLADGYGWRPAFAEWDWEETLAKVRRTVFPEEAQQLYGEGEWYGDRG